MSNILSETCDRRERSKKEKGGALLKRD